MPGPDSDGDNGAPAVTEFEPGSAPQRSRPKVRWQVVLASVAGILVVAVLTNFAISVPDRYRQWRDDKDNAARQTWLRTHAVIGEPWASNPGPYSEALTTCADGSVYGIAVPNGGILTRYVPAGTNNVRNLAKGQKPVPLVMGLGCDAHGALYTHNAFGTQVIRIPPHAPTDLAWANVGANTYGGLVVRADGAILIADAFHNRIIKVSPTGVVQRTWVSVGARPVGLAIAPDQTVYVDHERSPEITKISPSGVVTRNWATLQSSNPPGTPKVFGSDICSGSAPHIANITVDAQGNLIVGALCIWRFTPQGVGSRWFLANPDGQLDFVTALASATDGSIYGSTGGEEGGAIVRLTFPS